MAKNPTKDEALEALDFIINVLKEHEKDLDRLVGQLGTITETLGETGEISGKIEKVEERLSTIQTEVTELIRFMSSPNKTTKHVSGLAIIVRCRNWEDFKALATDSLNVSYQYKETENLFQADALKNGRLLTYSGELPPNTKLLRIWLSNELGIEKEKIFEGILSTK